MSDDKYGGVIEAREMTVVPFTPRGAVTHALAVTHQTDTQRTLIALCFLTASVKSENMPRLGPDDILHKDKTDCIKCLEWIRS